MVVRWYALAPGDKGAERFVVARGGDGRHDRESNFPWTVAAEIEANRCLNTGQGLFSEALISEAFQPFRMIAAAAQGADIKCR